MGANLYIPSEADKAYRENVARFDFAVKNRDTAKELDDAEDYKQWQEQVELAYRAMYPLHATWWDPYNKWSLMAQLGIDWAGLKYYIVDHGDGCASTFLDQANVKSLMALVAERRLGEDYAETSGNQLANMAMSLLGVSSPGPSVKGQMSAEDLEYFLERKKALLAFLQHALDLGEDVRVSY